MTVADDKTGALLLVLEPVAGENPTAGRALLGEGTRLAARMGVGTRLLTWAAQPDLDVEALAALLAQAAERVRPAAVLLADSDTARRLAPLVARALDSGAMLGCSDVLVRSDADEQAGGPEAREGLVFIKPVYGGWLEQEIEPAAGSIPVATLDLPGDTDSQLKLEPSRSPEVLEVPPGSGAIRSIEVIPPEPGTVDLVHAKRIVAAGMGSAGETLLPAVRELAELLEGSVGATRPVVDEGRLPKERLIGQTGRTVTPDIYLALGISGSPHHMAGVKTADRILSINRDVRAPIFQFSDVGYVADLESVLPALVRRIKEYRDAAGSEG